MLRATLKKAGKRSGEKEKMEASITAAAEALAENPVGEGKPAGSIERVADGSSAIDSTIEAVKPVVGATAPLIEPEISRLEEHSEFIMKGLNALSSVHPFVAPAVLAFKLVISLEVTRRQNNRMIFDIRQSMNSFFDVLLMLKSIGNDQGEALSKLIAQRIAAIADDITKCVTVCYHYQRSWNPIKLVASHHWASQLKRFITTFEGHKTQLGFELSVHSSIRIEELHKKSITTSEATAELPPPTREPLIKLHRLANAKSKLLQSQIDNLSMQTEMIIWELDTLSSIHPFVTPAVLAFKLCVQLQAARNTDDKRILAVRVAINDLFSTLLLLKGIKVGKDEPGQDGVLIEDRLAKRILSIADDIKECTKVCDAFQSKRTVIRLLKSFEWEGKLEGLISTFEEHKKSLESDMSMHASVRIEQVHTTLAVVSESVEATRDNTSMALVLQLLRSPEERELRRFIDSKGGADEFLKNDDLMQELIRKSENEPGLMSKTGQVNLVREIKREVGEVVADLVTKHYEQFGGRLDVQLEQLHSRMEASLRRESDWIIASITGNPHEQIVDLDLRNIWKDMGSKSTAKARDLAMNICEYCSQRQKVAFKLSEDQELMAVPSKYEPSARNVESAAETSVDTSREAGRGIFERSEDYWALEYITIPRIQPLLEAFDEDSSTLVSVAEVNAFTTACPPNWSLLQWMAFWTTGFPLTLKLYYTRVQILLSKIGAQVRNALQVNRSLVDAFVREQYITCGIDQFFAGVCNAVGGICYDDELFGRFKDYMAQEETRMQKMLQTLKYRIDAETTLRLITGPGRLEKSIMPLLYLLFVRVYQVIQHAQTVAIHPREVYNIVDSFDVIYCAIKSRVASLKAVCKLQDLNLKEQLQKYSHGMFYYMEFIEDLPQSKYWRAMYLQEAPRYYASDDMDDSDYTSPHRDVSEPTHKDFEAVNAIPFGEQLYPTILDTLNLEVYNEPSGLGDPILGGSAEAVLPTWCGFYSYTISDDTAFVGQFPAGALHLPLPEHGGQLSGTGTDSMGDFSLLGLLDGDSIVFNKKYTSSGSGSSRRHEGKLSTDRSTLSGVWYPWDNAQDDYARRPEPSEVHGGFELHVAPLRIHSRCFIELDSERLPLRRWHRAVDSVLTLLRIKTRCFSWDYFHGRRQIRRRFLELFPRLSNGSGDATMAARTLVPLSTEEADELSTLIAFCSKQDFQFYQSLSAMLQRRSTIHWGVCCDIENASVITDTRLVCLDCLRFDPLTGEMSETMNFCVNCLDIAVDRAKDDMHHVPSHEMLQLRFCATRRAEYNIGKNAVRTAKTLREEDGRAKVSRICYKCKSQLKRPYWYCCDSDCPENTCICMPCKAQLDSAYSPVLALEISHTADETPSSLVSRESSIAPIGLGYPAESPAPISPGYPDVTSVDRFREEDAEEVLCASTEGAAKEVGRAEKRQAHGTTTSLEQPDEGATIERENIGHIYTHSLILCRAFKEPLANAHDSKKLSIEDQLAEINERLKSLESMESRIMHRLGDIMERLSGSVVPHNTSSTTTITNPQTES